MRAWVLATRHPYVAVTGEDGDARLDRVPAGPHDLVFWHESLGSASRAASVTAGAEALIELSDGDFTRR
jgi:hypothetical protein